ncbi:MAG: amidohydrolase [Candidatus Asgardarchaeia archaeon]
MEADVFLYNGNFIILDSNYKDVDAIAIKYGLIVDIGNYGEIKDLIGSKTRVIDLKGKTVIPGFIDSHTHFISLGMKKMSLDLSNTKSIKEVLDLIERKVKELKPGEWIVGYGWDETKWSEKRYITSDDIDSVSQQNPVLLIRICGHMGTLNTLGLQILGFDKNPNIKFGIIKEKDLKRARDLLNPSVDQMEKAIELAFKEAKENGVTSLHDNVDEKYLKGYQTRYLKHYEFPVSIYLLIWKDFFSKILSSGFRTKFGNSILRIGAIKLMVDGSVGARTAAFFEPYKDDPSTRGIMVIPENNLYEIVETAHVNGVQLAIHAIGDRAIDISLDALKSAYKKVQKNDLRHRLEHVEFPTEEQIDTMKRLKIIASMQPNFVGNWGQPDGMYTIRLGKERWRRNNPFREFIEKGVIVAFGSDCMPFGPLYGLHFAVNHFVDESSISPIEALQAYTYNGAFASFEEEIKGSLTPGKYADLVVLSDNPLKNPTKIREIKVLLTIHHGKIVFSNFV